MLNGLLINWDWTLRVARRKVSLEEARATHLEELTEASGPLRLLGMRGVGLILGVSRNHAQALTREPGFPPHVATVSGTRAWYRSDLEAHGDKRRVPKREADELTPRLMGIKDVAGAVGVVTPTISADIKREEWHRIPRPAGRISKSTVFWMREDVEHFLQEYPERGAEFKRRRRLLQARKRPVKRTSKTPKQAKQSR